MIEKCRCCGRPLNDNNTLLSGPAGNYCSNKCFKTYVARDAIRTESMMMEEIPIDTLGLKPSYKLRQKKRRAHNLRIATYFLIDAVEFITKLGFYAAVIVLIVGICAVDSPDTILPWKMIGFSTAYMVAFMWGTPTGRRWWKEMHDYDED